MTKTWARQHITVKQVSKNGARTTFHRSPSGLVTWEHPTDETCEVCEALKS